ncbi:MAG: penicillin-binding protein 2 [Gammaproteobacteria bacterium]|nr:penicillin-binding protein 2 [Gammaproteobacteria bacterium]MCP4979577.1 penicillin-binding protein 2 [Gammaproteobacteria bacterium]
MSKREQLKDDYLENRLIRRRLVLSAIITLFLLSLVLGRMYMLQIVDYEHFSTLSDSNRVRIKALPPTRGLIFDRHGVVMANNLPAYRLEIVREQVEDLDTTLRQLQQYVEYTEQDLKRFKQSSLRRRPFESIPLRLNLNDEEVARLAVNLHRFEGVEINARLTRHYPQGEHAVHALGYVGRIDVKDLGEVDEIDYAGSTHIGKLGLEKFYEDELHGTVGVQQVEVNAKGRTLRVLNESPPVQGNNLHLTIDSKLQKVAEEAFGEYTGSVVAIDPNNGEILALVSMPIFNPNLFVNGISFSDYNKLRNSHRRPLFNRALSGQYPPGSTTKPFYGLAGLESAIAKKEQETYCIGFYKLPNEERRYRDWKKQGHGHMDLNNAITQSCDVYFYDLAYRLGIDRMSEFLAQFGFGVKTGVDSTSENDGLLPSRDWKKGHDGMPWFPGETLITGIGQGYLLVTPIQLANSTAAFSVKGVRYQPHLVKSVEKIPEYNVIEFVSREAGRYTLQREQNWEHVHKAMVNVVHGLRGTAHRISQGLQYQVAGKTGTAQVFEVAQDEEYDEETVIEKLRDHALFVSYAPADKPQIAVAVIVENGGHGSSVAAPIARRIMDAYLLEKS